MLKALFSQYKISFGLSLVSILFLVSAGIVFLTSKPTSDPSQTDTFIIKDINSNHDNGTSENGSVTVDVGGAVSKPGLYQFTFGSRIGEALEKAGGLKAGADMAWVEKYLNRAQKLEDGQKLYIPYQTDSRDVLSDQASQNQFFSKININTASSASLESLQGVGEKTAQKIIDNRPYSSTDELRSRNIVTQKVFDQIQDEISVF